MPVHLERKSPDISAPRRAFSLTELLVVIGIIVLLVGILLPVLAQAQRTAKRTETISTMEGFSKACDLFYSEFHFYPGLIPSNILEQFPVITSTENALLHLMGGGVRRDDYSTSSQGETLWNDLFPAPDWKEITFGASPNIYRVKINVNKIGNGPLIGGKTYEPFFTPRADQFGFAQGQVVSSGGLELPDLLDAWGQPIIFAKSMRDVGVLVGSPTASQFSRAGISAYTESQGLGDLAKSQVDSILNSSAGNTAQLNTIFAQIIRNEATGAADQPQTASPKGAYVLISAGPDGIFFSKYDGPGDLQTPVTDIVSLGPKVVADYDDIRIFGGG